MGGFSGSLSGRGDALRARALVLRTEPRIAGAPPASRRFLGRLVARSPLRSPRARSVPDTGARAPARPSGSPGRRRCGPVLARPGGRPTARARRRCAGALGKGDSPALADQLGVRPGRRSLVPDELPRKHHALDASAVGEHSAEEVRRARARCAHQVAPEPVHAVADGGRVEVPSGGAHLEAPLGRLSRSPPRVALPPALNGANRSAAVARANARSRSP